MGLEVEKPFPSGHTSGFLVPAPLPSADNFVISG
jgi:hypothetical protein